jgi:hypothetical protein
VIGEMQNKCRQPERFPPRFSVSQLVIGDALKQLASVKTVNQMISALG